MALLKKIWKKLVNFVKGLFERTGRREEAPAEARGTLSLTKYENNPIIEPREENEWEAWQTFNPGAVLINNNVHLMYRAIGREGISRFGYAVSSDGFHVDKRSDEPVYEHALEDNGCFYYSCASGGSWGGCEDPRLTRVEDEDRLYMTYTACDNGLRVALTSIKIEDFVNEEWKWKKPQIISAPNEVNKNWVIFPEKINGEYAILHSVYPDILIDYFDDLNFEKGEYIDSHYERKVRDGCWDSLLRGAGAPPLKTEEGWLLFYHAMSEDEMNKYKIGVMLLDLNEPSKVLHKSSEPVLKPEEDYEWNGFKGGVVYVSGAVIKEGKLIVYFGGADSYVCVAHADLNTFLNELVKDGKPGFEHKILKKGQDA